MKHEHLLVKLALGLILSLSGCLGVAVDPEGGGGPGGDPGDDPGGGVGPGSWTDDSFSWNGTLENAVLRLVVTGAAAGECRIDHAYRASGSVPGWDAFIAVESKDQAGWIFLGSAWHDARVHVGGSVDSSDLVEPYRSDGWIRTKWSLDSFAGDLVVHAASLDMATNGNATTFEFSLVCAGDAVVSQVSTGEDGVLFNARTVSGGAGVSASALFAGGGVTVRSGGGFTTDAPEVALVLAGFGQNAGRFELEGPGGTHEVLIEPTLGPDAGHFHTTLLQAPGSFSYVLDELAGAHGVNGALIGLTPHPGSTAAA